MSPSIKQFIKNNGAFLALGLVIVVVIVGLIGRSNTPGFSGGDNSDAIIDDRASIVNPTDIRPLMGDTEYINLTKDLDSFGRRTIAEYRDKDKLVLFNLEKVSRKDKEVTFTGYYTPTPKEIVSGKLILSKNGRMESSLTNDITGANIDSLLPSNSQRNKFIASLPISGEGYEIDYVAYEDAFSLSLLGNYTQAQAKAAQAALISGLKLSPIKEENYYFLIERIGQLSVEEVITQ